MVTGFSALSAGKNNLKRILFISSNKWHPWGGSEVLWFETARHFAENNFEVGVCIKKWRSLPPQFAGLQEKPNVQFFFRSQEEPAYLRMFNRFLPSKNRISRQDKYKAAILAWNPSLVVISQGDNCTGLEYMEFCAANNLHYVTISQAANEAAWPGDETCRRLSAAYHNANCNYFVSEANRQLTMLQTASQLNNSKVIRNPFNVDYNNSIEYPASKDGFKIAVVGRYDFVAKGQDILLQVLNSAKWRVRNVTINFYGKGMNKEGLNNLVRFFDLKNVYDNGFESTTRIWEQNHALAMCSRYEGLPLSVVEAMLCGRVCIVTDVSGNKELITDGINGFVARAANVPCLDEALERAWQKREEWKQMGILAKESVRAMVPENPSFEFYKELKNIISRSAE